MRAATRKRVRIDLSGQVFNRLRVLEFAETNSARRATWFCKCSCGEVVVVSADSLRSGNTQSCGCLRRERTGEAAIRTHARIKREKAAAAKEQA